MQFTYIDNTTEYDALLRKRIFDMRSKHVLSMESEKALMVFNESLHIGYKHALWGYGLGVYRKESENRIIQIHTIRRMIYDLVTNPFRIVIDSKQTAWVDNLHSAIRDILVFGEDVRIKDVPCYVIDLSKRIPAVFNYKQSLRPDFGDIYGALKAAYKQDGRVNDHLRTIGYTIGEFMRENQITREEINLTSRCYEDYREKIAMQRGDGYGAF